MLETIVVVFDGASARVGLTRSQAASLEQQLREATADPASLRAAEKIKSVLAGDESELTFDTDERTSLVTVLALQLPDLDESLREVYFELRDEARGEPR